MAKDPAINWYFDNWCGGTKGFTRHQKGCYMDLLESQFYLGHLSLEQVKNILGPDFSQWPTLKQKFAKDESGNFFNERLELEKNKRRQYSESRSKNRKVKKDVKDISATYVKHMKNIPETGIGTEDSEKDEGMREEKVQLPADGFFSDRIDKEIELSEMQTNATVEFISLICKVSLLEVDVDEYWRAFKIQQLGKHEWYNSFEDLLSHFRNSLKLSLNKNGSTKTNSNGTATSRSVASLLSGLD